MIADPHDAEPDKQVKPCRWCIWFDIILSAAFVAMLFT